MWVWIDFAHLNLRGVGEGCLGTIVALCILLMMVAVVLAMVYAIIVVAWWALLVILAVAIGGGAILNNNVCSDEAANAFGFVCAIITGIAIFYVLRMKGEAFYPGSEGLINFFVAIAGIAFCYLIGSVGANIAKN